MTDRGSCIVRVTSVARTVPDLAAAARFYRNALGVVPLRSSAEISSSERELLGLVAGRVVRLDVALGHQRITFLEFAPEGRRYPRGSTSSDLWFQHCAIVVGDMAQAHERILQAGAPPISEGGPQHLPANTGGVSAFKFRDPFGHPLELLGFPKGVGDPAWHQPGPALFLGIDHTAISVSDRETSCRFYVECLGLTVADRTRNRGAEQTRLDAVPEDDVDVVALAPRNVPPHLELLAYRTGTRRTLGPAEPADAAVSRTIAMGNVNVLAARLAKCGTHDVQLRRGTWDSKPALAFEDPDGHAWICREE